MDKKIPRILNCEAVNCAYNSQNMCRALAVSITDFGCPVCDTNRRSTTKGRMAAILAKVGICNSIDCRYNNLLQCTASGIKVGVHLNHADCLTFTHAG
ncbi:MAG: DUF1540 domain-containing protein [Spirochaetales bacterium]|nr:DUF1540 domain-containing protein [Spirochaetales bacterium]